MKAPPFLLGGVLLFWGWQTGYVGAGLAMGVLLEGSRVIKTRWEFSNDDFRRIWTFCTLIFLAAAVYAFTSNEGPSGFRDFFDSPNFFTQRNASNATSRTAASLVRWLPMLFCLFLAAQVYSTREGIPLETVSLILRWRWKRARKLGQMLPPTPNVDVSYPYFALCLFAASVHPSEDRSFFWGMAALVAWGLWPQRSKRFRLPVWGVCLALVLGLGYLGQSGVGRLQTYLAGVNPAWVLGFGRRHFDPAQSRTELGSIGRLKASSQIVVRLESRGNVVPPLLREASYRTLKGTVWFAESDKDFYNVPETNNTTYVLLPGKTNTSAVNIACYLDNGKGLLPLPSGSGRLENLTAYILSKNALGAVLVADGPGLVVFDAYYGPGETMDALPDSVVVPTADSVSFAQGTTNADTYVPPREVAAVDQVVAELGLNGKSMPEAVRTMNQYFLSKFAYSTWQPRQKHPDPNETPTSRFLLRTHRGHCEHFATAGVLLLRHMGIPARYAVGFAVHEGSNGKFVVRQRDAHAWCLVWDDAAQTWKDVDFTPGSWIAMEADRATPLQWLRDFWSRISFEFSKVRWGQSHWRRYLLWALVPTLALLLYRIIFQRRRRSRRYAMEETQPVHWPGLDSEFYELELKLAARGLTRQRSEPLSNWLQRAADDPIMADLRPSLLDVLRLHYRYRFDPKGLSPQERSELRREAKACLARLQEYGSSSGERKPVLEAIGSN